MFKKIVFIIGIICSTPTFVEAAARRFDLSNGLETAGFRVLEFFTEGPIPTFKRISLYIAVRTGDAQKLQQLIAAKADIHERNLYGLEIIFLAAREAHRYDCLKILLDAGAQFLIQDESGLEPLDYALCELNFAGAVLLMRHGALASKSPDQVANIVELLAGDQPKQCLGCLEGRLRHSSQAAIE